MNKTQATVFSLVLAAGIGTTWFTFQHLKKETEKLPTDEQGNVQTTDNPPDPAPETTPTPAPVEPPAPEPQPDPDPEAEKQAAREALFRDPEKLMAALSGLVETRDADAFIELAGEDAIDAETKPALIELLESPNYAPNKENPVIALARLSDLTRWAIQLDPVAMPEQNTLGPAGSPTAPATGPVTASVTGETVTANTPSEAALPSAGASPAATTGPAPSTGPAPAAPPMAAASTGTKKLHARQIYIDIREGDDKLLDITKVLVPGAPGTNTTGLSLEADPITVAHAFSRAATSGDFKTARSLTDPDKVTDERIAALMIALEEGAYQLKNEEAFVQTLSRDTVSWILTRVANSDTTSEFMLEMSRLDSAASWRIDNMTFDKVIQMTSASAGGGNVAYAPIVKNPQGGDSLVVFFEFDSSEINVRAQRQVGMIAEILKENPARQIKINGHADALGQDDYNSKLSARRAQNVRNALIALGVDSNQIVAAGLGETAPLSPNFKPDGSDNPSGRSQNRRSEIYLDF